MHHQRVRDSIFLYFAYNATKTSSVPFYRSIAGTRLSSASQPGHVHNKFYANCLGDAAGKELLWIYGRHYYWPASDQIDPPSSQIITANYGGGGGGGGDIQSCPEEEVEEETKSFSLNEKQRREIIWQLQAKYCSLIYGNDFGKLKLKLRRWRNCHLHWMMMTMLGGLSCPSDNYNNNNNNESLNVLAIKV